MDQRSYRERRHDSGTAERFDMAVRTALAFDSSAAFSYLTICGMEQKLIHSFADRFPTKVRAVASLPCYYSDRRNDSMQRAF